MNFKIQIGKIKFKNPVLVASGTFGYAEEFEDFFDLRKLGGIVTKTITVKPRDGNPPPRVVETPGGMLNAIGLQNPGAEVFVKEKLQYLRKLKIPVIASVMGYSTEEFLEVVGILDKADGIDGFELNLSCPNVSYGSIPENGAKSATNRGGRVCVEKSDATRMFAHDANLIEKVVSAIRGATKKTLIAKLSPDVSDITAMALAAERAGADAVSLINTLRAMVIDVNTRRPVLGNKTGGLSGPCVRPIAVRMVWETYKKVKVPIIGIGGIIGTSDALQFFIAGATAIQIGTANFVNPRASIEVLKGLERFIKDEKISDLKQLIGSVKD